MTFHNLSIKRKLTLLAMITCGVGLLAACVMFMAIDVVACRRDMVRNLKIYAAMVASNSTAALSFNDVNDATQTLRSLRSNPHVVDAFIFGPDGMVFATYARDEKVPSPKPDRVLSDSHRFANGHLEIVEAVEFEGRQIGTVFVRSDLKELTSRIAKYVIALFGVFIAASCLALLFASRLQRFISAPIQHLAETAKIVTEQKNYSIRAVKTGNDDLGLLMDGFNNMLEQIQLRDAGIKAHQDHLEEQVASRTEQLRKLNRDLSDARDRAEAASRAKTSFLANMSHEIRTPMTAIIGYSDMMLEPNQSLSDRQDCLQVIRRNGRHLLELINDILDISKIEAGKMDVERIACDLPQLVADVASLMRPRAIDKALAFNVAFKGPIPQQITTDALRVKQILMNLLGNAIKFTHMGGITLSVTCTPGLDSSQIRFDITDTGIGMTQAQVTHLFQPFSQADESMTRKYGGTGLGLTISKRLASLLGGDISVSSSPGEGSTFTVTIDGGSLAGVLLRTGIAESLAPTAPAPAERKIKLRGRILLAEDGPDNQRLISMHLRRAGADVTIAENGRIAVELARAERFDLIVMDMQMPELDGYGATSELRRRGFTQPIVALTAHALAEDRSRCMQAGCSDYLTKPIDKIQLLTTISGHLQNSSGSGQRGVQSVTGAASTGENSSEPGVVGPIRSAFADDPEMRELIAQFTDKLPDWVSELQRQLTQGNFEELRRVTHQMKGAGGGYGFSRITELAAGAESAIKESAALESITSRVNELVDLVRRVQGYNPAREGKINQEKR